jgi:probable HAF family extracellular repeat protein
MNAILEWLATDLASWTIHSLLGMSLVLGMVALVAALFAGHRPALRHALWLGALLTMAILPLVLVILPPSGWRIPVWQIPSLRGSDLVTSTKSEVDGRDTQAQGELVTAELPAIVPVPQANALDSIPRMVIQQSDETGNSGVWPSLLFLGWSVWAGGVLFLMVRLAVGCVRVRRLRNGTSPLDLRNYREMLARVDQVVPLECPPAIMVSSQVSTPCVTGFIRPWVMLPREAVQRDDQDALARMLIHEFAHIQRRDPWVLRLQRLVTIPLWFHPLVHWMNRELDRAREELCDNHVLRDSSPSNYAETLLALALHCANAPGPTLTLSIVRGEHRLESRIRRLLDGDRDRSTRLATKERVGSWSLIVGLTLGASGVRLDGINQPSGSEAAAPESADYQFIDIDPRFWPSDINAHRWVAGRLMADDGTNSTAAIWSPDRGLKNVVLPHATPIGPSALCAINDLGEFAGYFDEPYLCWIPFRGVHGGDLQRFPDLGGNQAPPAAINRAGQIVGWSDTPHDVSSQVHDGWRAFLFTPGQGTQDLGTLGGRGSQASSINDRGWVVGMASIPGDLEFPSLTRPFLWRPGQGMMSLGVLPGYSDSGSAADVNEAGHVVGNSAKHVRRELTEAQLEVEIRFGHGFEGRLTGPFTFHLSRPFLWTASDGMVALPCPPGFDSVVAAAINNRDEVLLQAYNLPPEDMHPALWNPKFSCFLVSGNVVTPLPNRAGFEQTQYLGMNDAGCLFGRATTTTRDDQAHTERLIASQTFLAIPRR